VRGIRIFHFVKSQHEDAERKAGAAADAVIPKTARNLVKLRRGRNSPEHFFNQPFWRLVMTDRKLDAAFFKSIYDRYGHTSVWGDVEDVLGRLALQVAILHEPCGIVLLGKNTAKLLLDDGHRYKLRFEHTTHRIELCRMFGTMNLTPSATFTNSSTTADIWRALHPKAAARRRAVEVAASADALAASL
jgi:hypothetical protein